MNLMRGTCDNARNTLPTLYRYGWVFVALYAAYIPLIVWHSLEMRSSLQGTPAAMAVAPSGVFWTVTIAVTLLPPIAFMLKFRPRKRDGTTRI